MHLNSDVSVCMYNCGFAMCVCVYVCVCFLNPA